MKIERGINGRLYVVFQTNVDAERYEWFFSTILRRRIACFDGYDNAYQLF